MLEKIILYNLFNNKRYVKKVFPHMIEEFFSDYESKTVFKLIRSYIIKYKTLPTHSIIKVAITKMGDLNESNYNGLMDTVTHLEKMKDEDWKIDWLVDETEKWCQERALYNGIMKSVTLIENNENTNAIPDIIQKALQVTFDTSIGIEFFSETDIAKRWEEYHKEKTKFSTGLNMLDILTDGGPEPKSLSIIMGQTNIGKTNAFCALTSNFIRNGYNVLYVTLEMAEEKITQRVEANLLERPINDIVMLNGDWYKTRLMDLKNRNYGRLIVKEFPTASINVNHIRAVLEEMSIKKEFVPDIIVIDYLNLMNSVRVKGENMYSVVKSIAEEVRGLAVEGKFAIISGTQVNRPGYDSTDIDLTDTSESIGLPATVDLQIGIMFPPALKEQNIQVWKILKNRFSGIVNYKFPIKVKFDYAKLEDVDKTKDNIDITNEVVINDLKAKEEKMRQKRKNIKIIETDEIDNISDSSSELLEMMEDS